MSITIYDIAKETGVSPSTVSRVINGSAGVSEEKRKKIEDTIKKRQFRPNAIASGLKKKKSQTIGFILPDVKNPYFATIFYELQIRAKQKNYLVFLCNTDNDRDIELKALYGLLDKQVEAIVLMGGGIDDLPINSLYLRELVKINQKVPLILTTDNEIDCHYVINDEREGMKHLIKYLSDKGHKTVGLLGGNDNIKPSYNRRKYFVEFVEQFNMTTKNEWIIDSGYNTLGGIKAMEQLWQLDDKPTAVCGISDLVAMGILNYCYKSNIVVPKDIAVIGCDGIPQSRFTSPSLTTMATDYSAFSKAIMQHIFGKNKDNKKDYIKVGMNIIKGEST